jgi:hypothetical protein
MTARKKGKMTVTVETGKGIGFLKQELAQKEADATKRQAEIMALRQAIAILEGSTPDELPRLRSTEYEDLGITAATKRFLREVGEPQDTRSIADALRARGLKSESKNFIATLYATLNNGKQWFERTTDGRWALRGEESDKGGRSR